MKRILSVCLSFLMFLSGISMPLYAADHSLEGSGTAMDPWKISDVEDFETMSSLINGNAAYADDYYIMTNDIDFNGGGMTPIGRTNHFKGIFDGQFFDISNVVMNDTAGHTGIFGFVENGTVRNVGIKDSTITSTNSRVAALIGRTMNAYVLNCYAVNVNVSGTGDVGGIVGMHNSSKLFNCFVSGTMNSSAKSSAAGGIAGSFNTSLDRNNPVTVDNVVANVTATSTTYAGSITGWNEGYEASNPVALSNAAYTTGIGIGNSDKYSGYNEAALGITNLADDASLEDMLAYLNENLKTGYAKWNVDANGNIGFETKALSDGTGSEEDPYIIDSVEDLITMADVVDTYISYASAYYRLDASLDLSGVDFSGIGYTNPFSGTFDGNNHVIKNININTKGENYSGFFRKIQNATIKNLGIESGNITGGAYVGGISGYANNSTIINCFNNAEIYGYYDCGGIIGQMIGGSIQNSFNKGKIRVFHKSIGGLAGSLNKNADVAVIVSNSYNIGQVNVSTYTGKIAGFDDGSTFQNVYYDKDAAIVNQPLGTLESAEGIIGMSKEELTSEAFVDTLNANLVEGYSEWVYGEDGIARLKAFEEVAKLDIFMASIQEAVIENNKVQDIVSEDGTYKAVLYGSDNRYVIDLDGNVYEPLTNQEVLLIYNIVDTTTNEVVAQLNRNIAVVIEGQYPDAGINLVPNVMPGLQEWYGLEGNWTLDENTDIVTTDPELAEMAVRIQTYMKDMFGYELAIKDTADGNDIVLDYDESQSAYLQDEGYLLDINQEVKITAASETGILYGAISIMQILYQDEAHDDVPKGIVRDYPRYELRGGMMDVARKYFSIDYVEEIGKYMSWFKMNTLHLHINDNGGEYGSSFVVESKKYPALNNANGQYIWTQDEYRQLQKNLKEFGINVITEIDTPGHAKAFANVNGTIVSGASFNLGSYYDESIGLVEDVFDEFLDGDDPVFQSAIVHIGTDESSNTKENMRKYINELSQYMLAKDNVDKVVFWGNLSLYYGQNEVKPENVIAQIWDSADFRADEALDQGFEVINSTSNMMYLVPNQGSTFGKGTFFSGRVLTDVFYDTWKGASDFNTHNIPNPFNLSNGHYYAEHDILKGNPKVLGAVYCNWNDTGVGYDYDLMELMVPYIAGVSERTWYGDRDRFENGAQFEKTFNEVGDFAAYANPRYKVPTDKNVIASYDFNEMNDNKVEDIFNDYDAAITNGMIVEDTTKQSQVLKLTPDSSMSLPFDGVGYPYTAQVDLYLDGTQSQDAVLFQSDECKIYLDYDGRGVCFQSGKYVYAFNARIPENEWVSIKITSKSPTHVHASSNITVLTINETEYTPTNITNSRAQSRSTIFGTETMFSGINGSVDNLSITKLYNFDATLGTYQFDGSGTQEDPYLIQTSEDLVMLSNFTNAGLYLDAYYKLTNDIDMTGVKYATIAEFKGTFDGNNHIISNLVINDANANEVALIGYLDGGIVKNLGIVDSSFTGKKYVAAIAARTMHAKVMNCFTNATIIGDGDIGGLVGMFNSSHMYNCYSLATVKATGTSAGGIAGSLNSSLDLENPVVVDNVYSVATVTAKKYPGIIAGWDEGGDMENTPVYFTNGYYVGSGLACGNVEQRDGVQQISASELNDGTLLQLLNDNLDNGYETWVKGETSPTFRSFLYDINALEEALAQAAAIDTTYATAETKANLEEAIEAGRAAMIPESQQQIDNAIATLQNAMKAMEYEPKQIMNLVAEAIDYKTVKLSWDVDGYADYYVVERINTSANEWIEVAQTSDAEYVATVKTGKAYTYRVKGVKAATDVSGAYSEEVSVTTQLSGEVELNITNNGTNKFDLTWSAVDGATRYIIYRRSNGGEWKKILTLGKDARSYTTREMSAGTYEYQVKAGRYDSTDRVMSAGSNVVTGTIDEETITLSLEVVSATSVKLTWTKQVNCYSYELYRSSNQGNYRLLKKGNVLSYLNESLKEGKNYAYKVRGVKLINNEKVYTPFSNEVTH